MRGTPYQGLHIEEAGMETGGDETGIDPKRDRKLPRISQGKFRCRKKAGRRNETNTLESDIAPNTARPARKETKRRKHGNPHSPTLEFRGIGRYLTIVMFIEQSPDADPWFYTS
jgi:hypothetical protein